MFGNSQLRVAMFHCHGVPVLFGSFWQEMNMIKPGDNVVALHGQKEECPGVFLSSWMRWWACNGLQVGFTWFHNHLPLWHHSQMSKFWSLCFLFAYQSHQRDHHRQPFCVKIWIYSGLGLDFFIFLLYTLKKQLVYSMQTGDFCRSGIASPALGTLEVTGRCPQDQDAGLAMWQSRK